MLEQMRYELAKSGVDVYVTSINKADAVDNQKALLDRCAFPLLQDTAAVKAWDVLGGHKDDMFVYSADGKLADFLPSSGPRNTDLSTPAGYSTVKNAILAAHKVPAP